MNQIYAYKCRTCGYEVDSDVRADSLGDCSPNYLNGCTGELRRVFVISMTPPMMPHFNKSVGREITDAKQHKHMLARLSDEYTARTNIPTKFEPVDMRDSAALGVTGDGLDATNRERHKKGLPDVRLT